MLCADLAEHLRAQADKIRLPKKTALCDFRLLKGYASMLHARETLFNPESEFWLRTRLDSSPQYNGNYLVGECDVVHLTGVSFQTWTEVFHKVCVQQRLMPLQVLGNCRFG